MLRLFSSIRKSLVTGNNTVKYLKYALGEFLLIVAGILMALQIQTWNEERKLENQRQELIENLKVDFHLNLERIDNGLANTESVLKGLEEFLRIAAGGTHNLNTDELRALASKAFRAIPFKPSFTSYNAAKSTGLINSIEDRALRELFAEIEYRIQIFNVTQEATTFDQFSGGTWDLRLRFGSLGWFYNAQDAPKPYRLPTESFEKAIATKEVHATFENKLNLKSRSYRQLEVLKDTTEQILYCPHIRNSWS